MSLASHQQHIAAVIALIAARQSPRKRMVIAIAGPPASGKTTLAQSVVQQLNEDHGKGDTRAPYAALLPMDGYHLDNAELSELGLLPRKGAVETFDQAGYCEDLKRVADGMENMTIASFDRDLDCVIPNAITIDRSTDVVVAEGNYLLLNAPPWRDSIGYYDATVFVRAPIDVLRQRLFQRWADQGLNPSIAEQKVTQNDLPNAKLVLGTSLMPDLVIEHTDYDLMISHSLTTQKLEQSNEDWRKLG